VLRRRARVCEPLLLNAGATITVLASPRCQHRRMVEPPAERRRRISREDYAERFARGDSYGLLLALLMVLYITLAASRHESLWARFFISVLLGGVLLLAFHTSHVRARGLAAGIVLVAIADFSNLFQAVFERRGDDGSTYIMFVLVLVAPIVILNRIIRHDTVGLETILGAICVYVLIGIAFAGIYAGVNDAEPSGFFAQDVVVDNVNFLYFSFVTITTVGYGDLTAGTSTGRVLVTFEALIGQIFLVTLVARLVAMYGATIRRPRAGPGDDDDLGDEA
jgi:Ion channel